MYSLLFGADIACVLLGLVVLLPTGFADEIITSGALNLLIENEEKPTEASHAAVLVKFLLFG